MHILWKFNAGGMMVHPDNIPEMERELAARGVSVAELCRRAGIAETTWGRWKRKEVSPTYKTWDLVAVAYAAVCFPSEAAE